MTARQGFLAICLVAVLGGAPPGWGQDEPEPKSELQIEADEAKLRKEIAEAKLAAAKAQKDFDELDDPESDFEVGRPGITVKDKAGYYGTLLSFVTLEEAAEQFVSHAATKLDRGNRIVVTSDFELTKAMPLWHWVDLKVTEFASSFALAFPPPPAVDAPEALGPTLAAVTGTLGAVAEIASFFRTQREMHGLQIAASSEALVAVTVRELVKKDLDPVLPELVVRPSSTLTPRLQGVIDAKEAAQGRAKGFQADLKKAKEALQKDPGNAPLKREVERLEAHLKKHTAPYEATVAEWTKLLTRLETVPEKSIRSPLEVLYAYEAVMQDGAHVLIARAISQGGDVEVSSGALRRTKISFVGGSVALFYLAAPDGKVVAADLVPIVASQSFTGRVETRPPRRLREKVSNDDPDDPNDSGGSSK